MLLTEEQAREKVCQEGINFLKGTNAHILNDGGHQTVKMTVPDGGCIGSGCMAWRWLELPSERRGVSIGYMLAQEPVRYSDTHGYCGKAGKP
jgi:hypothetical protein